MRKIALLIMMVVLWENTKAVTCYSNCSGNWESPSTWSCGRVPGCGDTICIMGSHIVTVSTVNSTLNNGAPVYIMVYGTLNFNTGKQLSLACNSCVSLKPGPPKGQLTAGNGGGASNQLTICNTLVWQAGDGDQEGPKDFTGPGTLPVELLSIDVKNNMHVVELYWTTASERDNAYFEILRSGNGELFNVIGKVNGSGTTNKLTNYKFIDEKPNKGLSYYRLRQIDNNGDMELHSIVSVNWDTPSNFNLFPNPFLDQLQIVGIEEDQIRVSIFNIMGELIETRMVGTGGSIDYKHLTKGSYLFKVESLQTNNLISRRVLIKQ